MKRVFTLGPATQSPALIARLVQSATAFRLNASHLGEVELAEWLDRVHRVFLSVGRTIPVVIDLQGAKMRIGNIAPLDELPREVRLVCRDGEHTPEEIPVPHPELFQEVGTGEKLLLNDSRIVLRVKNREPNMLLCTVEKNGPLSAHKGINRAEHPVPYRSISPKDRRAIGVAMEFSFTEFAFSFVQDGSEAAILRPLTGTRPLTAKLELPTALENLPAIDKQFDSLWLCRGDLGAQVGLRALGALQERFSQVIPQLTKPAWLAGQVLEHMTTHPWPTRSEAVHLYDVSRLGYSGIVLSDETAIGKHIDALCEFLDEFDRPGRADP